MSSACVLLAKIKQIAASIVCTTCILPHPAWLQVDVLLATPLRLARALKRQSVSLAEVRFLIMDEADKLFEEGLLSQIDSIVHACSRPDKVTLLLAHCGVVDRQATSVSPRWSWMPGLQSSAWLA